MVVVVVVVVLLLLFGLFLLLLLLLAMNVAPVMVDVVVYGHDFEIRNLRIVDMNSLNVHKGVSMLRMLCGTSRHIHNLAGVSAGDPGMILIHHPLWFP